MNNNSNTVLKHGEKTQYETFPKKKKHFHRIVRVAYNKGKTSALITPLCVLHESRGL